MLSVVFPSSAKVSVNILPREDKYPSEDCKILRRATALSSTKCNGKPYITIKEAQAYIGYPDVKLNLKG